MDNTHNYLDANYLRNVHQGDVEQGDEASRQNEDAGAVKTVHMLLLAALFLLPFVFIPIAGWGVSVGKVVVGTILGLASGVAVFGALRRGTLVLPKTYTALLLGMFVLLLLSTIFSDSIVASFFGAGLEVGTFFTTAVAIALALTIPVVLTSRKQLVSALFALFVGGGVLALFHITRILFGPEALSFGYFLQPSSTPAGSWNDLGIFFAVIYLLSIAGVMFGNVPVRTRKLLSVALVVSLGFVALVNFQLLSIALAITTFILLAILFVVRRDRPFMPAVAPLLFLIIISVFSSYVGAINGELFGTTYAEIRPNWSNTQDMLGAGLSDIKNVVLGQGPNTYAYLWQQERAQEVIDSTFWSIDFAFATGLIPTFAVTLGLIMVLAMLTFAGYLTSRVYNALQNGPSSSLLSTVVIASGLAAVFLWAFSIIYVFSVLIFFLMFMLSGVAAAALTQMRRVETVEVRGVTRTGALIGFLGAMVGLSLIVLAVLIAVSRTLYGQAVMAANTATEIEDVARAQEKIRQASMLERNDSFARTETELGLVRIQEFISREDTDETDVPEYRRIVAETQEAAERARTLNPQDYLNWVNAGLVYETLGLLEVENGFDLAEQSYAQARVLNPTNPELVLIQARLERARGNTEEAVAFAEEALALKENYEEAHLFLADVALANENVAGAINRLEAGVEARPQSSLLNYQLGLVHYLDGSYDLAIESFTSALILDAGYANARYFRALSYVYGENDRALALEDLEKVRANNPDNEALASVIANIESGNDPLEGVESQENVELPTAEGDTSPEANVEVPEGAENAEGPEGESEEVSADSAEETEPDESIEESEEGSTVE